MKRIFAACIVFALAVSAEWLRADTIIFKNGEEMDGTILEKDENAIKFEVEKGTVLIPMERVRRIDPDTPEKIAEREQKKQAALEFAEKMKADGKVQYKGKWVTEDEKKVAEQKIKDDKQKKKDAEEAKKKADEAAAAALKAAADKAAQEANNNQDNNTRSNRFNRRHNRDDLNNDPMNNGTSTNNYGSNINNNSSYSTQNYNSTRR